MKNARVMKKNHPYKTTSMRLSYIVNKQLEELSQSLGENLTKVISRAICELHDKYFGGNNDHRKGDKAKKK